MTQQTQQTQQAQQVEQSVGFLSAIRDIFAVFGLAARGARVAASATVSQVINADAALTIGIEEGLSSMSESAKTRFQNERKAKLEKYELDQLI